MTPDRSFKNVFSVGFNLQAKRPGLKASFHLEASSNEPRFPEFDRPVHLPRISKITAGQV